MCQQYAKRSSNSSCKCEEKDFELAELLLYSAVRVAYLSACLHGGIHLKSKPSTRQLFTVNTLKVKFTERVAWKTI